MHVPPNFMTREVSQLLITYFDILLGCNTVDLMEFTAQGSFVTHETCLRLSRSNLVRILANLKCLLISAKCVLLEKGHI